MYERLLMLLDSAERSLSFQLDKDIVFSEELYYEIKSSDDERFYDFSLLRSNMLELREIEEKYYLSMRKVKERIGLVKERI